MIRFGRALRNRFIGRGAASSTSVAEVALNDGVKLLCAKLTQNVSILSPTGDCEHC